MRHDVTAKAVLESFSNPEHVARYAEGPPRFVPGFADLHSMTGILLAEHAPQDAKVLVLGAGGGLELKALAETHSGWTFAGVDPAAEMLKLAERTLGPLASRVRLHPGTIDDAPEGPFDAATCLLTLHFLDAEERRRTASENPSQAQTRRALRGGAFQLSARANGAATLVVEIRRVCCRSRSRTRASGERTRGGRCCSLSAQPGAG